MRRIYRLTEPLAPDSEIIADLVRIWREARKERLQFLSDLHSADEDCAYLCRAVLPENEVWVAEVDERIAAFIAFGHEWVQQLYVAPVFQGRGVGTELLKIAMGCNSTLKLWVFEANLPAIQFYERRGFRVVERTDGAGNEAKRPDLRMQWSSCTDCSQDPKREQKVV
jgi:putative acetyltransferase